MQNSTDSQLAADDLGSIQREIHPACGTENPTMIVSHTFSVGLGDTFSCYLMLIHPSLMDTMTLTQAL